MRICSLLPSATEILFALDLGNEVVGVTHECDYPPEARQKPRVVQSVIDQSRLSSETIDRLVVAAIQRRESLYRIDLPLLNQLCPDLIVTQELCDVCAIDARDVAASLRALSIHPTIVSLHPHTLQHALQDILLVGAHTGRASTARRLVEQLQARIERVRQQIASTPRRPRVCCLEWLDPVMVSGHWVPEMVELAGGTVVLGRTGEPSGYVKWEDVLAVQPEVLVLMPCGFPIERTRRELALVTSRPGWEELPAVWRGQVYLVNGPAYFNQSGPRLIDGLEILAALIHPECGQEGLQAHAAERL